MEKSGGDSDSILEVANLDVHKKAKDSMAKQKKIGIVVRPTRTEARTKTAKRPQPPVAVISEMTNSEIKRRTGFDDINMLLAFLAIVCNGHFNMMTEHVSALTWFEEWLLYF